MEEEGGEGGRQSGDCLHGLHGPFFAPRNIFRYLFPVGSLVRLLHHVQKTCMQETETVQIGTIGEINGVCR